jgi:hypothetical protein
MSNHWNDDGRWDGWVALGWLMVLVGLLTFLMATLLSIRVHARDLDGRYAGTPLHSWFDSLRSGKGPCCSDADGTALSDVDWESRDGHYRVRVPIAEGSDKSEWVDVPEDAILTQPNLSGRTMVWPFYGYQGLTIRCFIVGAQG